MRIHVTLAPLQYPAAIPVNQHPLASFIYETIGVAAPDLAGWLHDEGVRAGVAHDSDRRFRFFVFGLPDLPPYHFHAGQKWFDEGVVYWQISSPLPEFIEALVAGLAARGVARLGGSEYAVTGLEIMPPPLFAPTMRFMALSPLMVATTAADDETGRRRKHYVRPGDPRFAALVAENLREKYRALHGQEPPEANLAFAFDHAWIEQAGGYDSRRVTRLAQYKGTNIKCCLAPFVVAGSLDLIRLGWECGFGAANAQGFGMAGI
ncbi:MAG: CRISPR-associated endoribonuclease Cas6 [Blastocatellia bacterium]